MGQRRERRLLASGGDDPDLDLRLRALIWMGFGYPPPRVDHRFKDGDTIVRPIALAAHVTAGHTRGCTS